MKVSNCSRNKLLMRYYLVIACFVVSYLTFEQITASLWLFDNNIAIDYEYMAKRQASVEVIEGRNEARRSAIDAIAILQDTKSAADDAIITKVQKESKSDIAANANILLSSNKQENNDNDNKQIPHRVIIIDTRYNGIHNIPSPRKENTWHTLEVYQKNWKNKKKNISNNTMDDLLWYLGDTECIHAINDTEPRLLDYYYEETKGQYKADICRIAALYLKGGYYFDTDVQVVQPVTIPPHVTFVSPFECPKNERVWGFFNSFIAATANHPILRINLDFMLEYYKGKRRFYGTWMGPGSLLAAYKTFQKKSSSSTEKPMAWPLDTSLAEVELKSNKDYPTFPRHNGTGCCCDFVVHNKTEKNIYFYSRIKGASSFCS